jgi:hypothetical protein
MPSVSICSSKRSIPSHALIRAVGVGHPGSVLDAAQVQGGPLQRRSESELLAGSVPRGLVTVLRDDIRPLGAGGDEGRRSGACLVDVDRWRLGRLLVEGGRPPQPAEAQDQNLER